MRRTDSGARPKLVECHIRNHEDESAGAHLLEESDALGPKLVVKHPANTEVSA
jgi:hypothetical protein